jgi:hypothetical protein
MYLQKVISKKLLKRRADEQGTGSSQKENTMPRISDLAIDILYKWY